MRLNIKQATKTTQQASQTQQNTTPINVLFDAEVVDNKIQFYSLSKPSLIIWKDSSGTVFVDENPKYAELNDTGYVYKPSNTSITAVSARYVPSEDMLMRRLISTLGVTAPYFNDIDSILNYLNLKLEGANRQLTT